MEHYLARRAMPFPSILPSTAGLPYNIRTFHKRQKNFTAKLFLTSEKTSETHFSINFAVEDNKPLNTKNYVRLSVLSTYK
ncbi:MAG: hypothetical protein ACOYJF_05380, partial [Prevotella sp.]